MKRSWAFGCLVTMAMAGAAAGSDAPTKAKVEPQVAEVPPIAEAAAGSAEAAPPEIAHLVGPQQVELGHHVQIDLPAGMVLLEAQAAQELMRKMGNATDGIVAAIAPTSDTAKWLVVIEAEDIGYVNDRDADELDAAAMLEQFVQGTRAQNKQRIAAGVAELFVDGWSEPPRYEPATHHLVWGLNAHDKDGKVVNFFTRILGRNGYVSVDLIDDPTTIEQSKADALAILTAVHFTPGFRYEDHTEGDRDSGIGLKTLVLGGTAVVLAKKGGILIAILLVLKKGFIVIAVAVGVLLKRVFGRKQQESPSYAAMAAEPLTDSSSSEAAAESSEAVVATRSELDPPGDPPPPRV